VAAKHIFCLCKFLCCLIQLYRPYLLHTEKSAFSSQNFYCALPCRLWYVMQQFCLSVPRLSHYMDWWDSNSSASSSSIILILAVLSTSLFFIIFCRNCDGVTFVNTGGIWIYVAMVRSRKWYKMVQGYCETLIRSHMWYIKRVLYSYWRPWKVEWPSRLISARANFSKSNVSENASYIT